jgi:hypothetical protein
MRADDPFSGTLSAQDARDALARAAALDVAQRDAVPVSRLREAAVEAGIGVESLDRAVAEVLAHSVSRERAPLWVRLGLFGVVDRAGAMVFYWLFVAMSLVMPAYVLFMPGRAGLGQRVVAAVGLAVLTGYSVWSTARAVRWADRHGWDKLR